MRTLFQNDVPSVKYSVDMESENLPRAPRLPSRGGQGRQPRQRGLSQDAIVDAALEIVDREGLDALTMRTVAHTLGTGPASLYAHVANKEQLVELLVERVIGEIEVGDRPDPDLWAEQVKQAARAMRRTFASHGDLARASFGRIPTGENALRGAEWMMAVLRVGGISDEVAGLAVDMLAAYVMAIAYEDGLGVARGTTETEIVEFIAQLRAYYESLPRDRFPNLVELAGPLTAGDGDTRFEFGLEVLLRGLEAVSQER
jgi:AcrR family transcriptional regulator